MYMMVTFQAEEAMRNLIMNSVPSCTSQKGNTVKVDVQWVSRQNERAQFENRHVPN